MILIKEFEFDAAHHLTNYHGKCERIHGHTYKLVVKLQGQPDETGMIFDFVRLKRLVNLNILNNLDHHDLNEILPNPSAENIAIYVWGILHDLFLNESARLYEIELWETKTSGIVYRGELN